MVVHCDPNDYLMFRHPNVHLALHHLCLHQHHEIYYPMCICHHTYHPNILPDSKMAFFTLNFRVKAALCLEVSFLVFYWNNICLLYTSRCV